MNKDHISGKADSIKGSVKSATSELTGSNKHKAEGTADKVKGAVKQTIADAKDKVADVTNKISR